MRDLIHQTTAPALLAGAALPSPPLTRRGLLGGTAASALVAACARPAAPEAPWQPQPLPLRPDLRWGFNFAHQHVRGRGYGSPPAAAALDEQVALGMRDLALNPFGYAPSLGSTDLRWGDDPTMTDDDLRRQAEAAQSRGLRLLMKPHLWSPSHWGGAGNMDIRLDAAGWARWFEAYAAFVSHYARLAQEIGCEGLCVGLEYTQASLENPGAWAQVAAACRTHFKGRLCYAANWFAEFEHFADWAAFDCAAVDAYFPLEGQTVAELVTSWQPHLDLLEKAGKTVIFTEAGYRAVEDGHREPWSPASSRPDPALQARAYEALLRAAVARPWFGGVYWWKWFTAAGPDDDSFVPQSPARAVLRAWSAAR